jgi:hypothetical protein
VQECVFLEHPITHSWKSRSVIPETPDHPFLEVPIGKVVCG